VPCVALRRRAVLRGSVRRRAVPCDTCIHTECELAVCIALQYGTATQHTASGVKNQLQLSLTKYATVMFLASVRMHNFPPRLAGGLGQHVACGMFWFLSYLIIYPFDSVGLYFKSGYSASIGSIIAT